MSTQRRLAHAFRRIRLSFLCLNFQVRRLVQNRHLNDFKTPSFAKFCKIFARKLFEILSSFEIVSTSTGDDF